MRINYPVVIIIAMFSITSALDGYLQKEEALRQADQSARNAAYCASEGHSENLCRSLQAGGA